MKLGLDHHFTKKSFESLSRIRVAFFFNFNAKDIIFVWCFLNLFFFRTFFLLAETCNYSRRRPMKNFLSSVPSILCSPCRRINRLARSRVIKLTWEARDPGGILKSRETPAAQFLSYGMLIDRITFLPGRKTGISLSSVTRSKFATFSAEFGKLGEELRLLSSLHGKIVKFLPQIYLRDVRIALNGTVK